MLEPEISKERRLINVNGDFLGAALGGDMLGLRQLHASLATSQADEIIGDQRHSPPRTFLPRRVSGRVHDDLTHDSPARVMRVAARDEKPCERLCHSGRFRLGPMNVEMSQGSPHATAVLNRPGEPTRRGARVS